MVLKYYKLVFFVFILLCSNYSYSKEFLGGDVERKAFSHRLSQTENHVTNTRGNTRKKILTGLNLRHYKYKYIWLYATFLPYLDLSRKESSSKYLNVVFAVDTKKDMYAKYVCVKQARIRDYLITYAYDVPLRARDGFIDYNLYVRQWAKALNKLLGLKDLIKYVILFEGAYNDSNFSRRSVINNAIPNSLIMRCIDTTNVGNKEEGDEGAEAKKD